MLEGARIKARREHNDRAWLAWQIVTLPTRKGVRFSDITFRDGPARVRTSEARAEAEFAAFATWANARASIPKR